MIVIFVIFIVSIKLITFWELRFLVAGSQYNTAVVLDNGAGVIKLGMAGDKMPTLIEPAVYGIPKRYSLQMAGMDNKRDRLYGSSATAKAGVMQLGE